MIGTNGSRPNATPNAVARILDPSGCILNLANNYAKMSFNFGLTLLSWLEANSPEVYGLLSAMQSR